MADGKDEKGAATAAPLVERLLKAVARLFGALSTALILLLLALTAYSVFMRYVIGRPPVWIDELTGFLLVAAIMFGVTEAFRRNDHISIDLVTSHLGERSRRLSGLFSDLCVLGFALVLGISSWEAIEFARMFGSYTPGAIEIESWIPQVPMLIGSVALGAFAIARFIGHLTAEFGK